MGEITRRKFGALSSSENPEKLADTVKGVIIGLATIIIYILGSVGIDIGNAQIMEFATNLGFVISSLWTAYGLVKKFILWLQKAWSERRTG